MSSVTPTAFDNPELVESWRDLIDDEVAHARHAH